MNTYLNSRTHVCITVLKPEVPLYALNGQSTLLVEAAY